MSKRHELAEFLHANLPPNSSVSFGIDGRLTVESTVKQKGKNRTRRAALQFDDPATLEGPAVIAFDGPYGEHLSRQVFFACLFVGQGEQPSAPH